ncbi:nucleotidyltransferase family protein [Spirochaeta thermophila]|uniref:nucleotidyltransferase family protein n=1 Tax=Winmispira thermophila TaxID=154 RepID=UPI0005A2F9FC|nr:nucleotidyltransferase domain-containing protein [Spirochaeta thermophila]
MPRKSSSTVKVFYPRYSREEVLHHIRASLPLLREALPVLSVVLFGSYAKGTNTAFSDIDLLVVYQDPPRQDAYTLVKRSIPLRGLEPHVYARSEYEQVNDVVERMIEGGVRVV